MTPRKAAKALGLKRYYTGKPCPYGHVCERITTTARCVECVRIKDSKDKLAAYARDPEKFRERKRAAYARDPEKHKADKKRLYDKDKVVARNKRWREKNPDKVKLMSKVRDARRKASGKARLAAKRRGSAEGTFSVKDVRRLLEKQSRSCAGCGVSFDFVPYTVDHIVAIAKGGSNWPDNIQLMCKPCNDSKGSKSMADWYPPWDANQIAFGE